jgi:hypothetical protein
MRAREVLSRVRAPVLSAIAACAALAALSAAVLPTVPSYDPWAWIGWGRELVDPHLSFVTGNGPSWKPLPVVFTTVWGLFGGAGPTLWVITARAGGLLAPVAAWRLASRLVRDIDSPLAGPIAGVVAVLGVVLTQDFFYYMYRGTSEPMLVACWLWAFDRVLAQRHGQAYAFLVAASLIRPEAWPFLGVYAIWLWLREPRLRVLVLVGLAAIPLCWFVPTKIGSGEWFLAASHAKAYNGHLGAHPVLEALRRAADLQVAPVLAGAAVAVGFAWFRGRDRVVLALAGAALAWVVLVVGMVAVGYPGLERFFLPASALFSVLAGVGVARVALLAGSRIATPAGARATALVVAAAVLAVSIPLSSSRISNARAQKPIADRAVIRLDQLSDAIKAVGGHAAVYPCRSSVTAINHAVQTALAWKLHVTLNRVGTVLRHPGVLFVGPHDSIDGGPASVSRRLTQRRLLAHVGRWYVYRVTATGHPRSNRCAGH